MPGALAAWTGGVVSTRSSRLLASFVGGVAMAAEPKVAMLDTLITGAFGAPVPTAAIAGCRLTSVAGKRMSADMVSD